MASHSALPGKLSTRYYSRRIGAIVRSAPPVFVAACKALGVSAVEFPYLGKHPVLLDVNGRSIVNDTLCDGSSQRGLFTEVAERYGNRSALFITVGRMSERPASMPIIPASGAGAARR